MRSPSPCVLLFILVESTTVQDTSFFFFSLLHVLSHLKAMTIKILVCTSKIVIISVIFSTVFSKVVETKGLGNVSVCVIKMAFFSVVICELSY